MEIQSLPVVMKLNMSARKNSTVLAACSPLFAQIKST